MKNKLSKLGLAVLLALGSINIFADEISEQIQSGLDAYADKDFKLALDELKFAEAQLQELVNKENSKLLPEPFDGWDAKDVETTSLGMAGGGSVMSRKYSKGKQTMKIEIAANSPLLSMMSMMMKNPMMMASNPKSKPFRYKRQKGMVETKNGRRETKLILAGQVLLTLTLNDRDKDRLEESGKETTKLFLEKLDIAKIKESLLE